MCYVLFEVCFLLEHGMHNCAIAVVVLCCCVVVYVVFLLV